MLARSLARPTAILIAALAASVGLAAQETPAPSVQETEVATAPVELDGVELFRVRGVSSLPAEQRAIQIHGRIVAVARDPSISLDTLHVVEADGLSRIQAGDRLVMGVHDADAKIEEVDRSALAAAHLQRIRHAITAYRNDRTDAAIENSAWRAVVATLVLAAALLGLRWLFRWSNRRFAERLRGRIRDLEAHSFDVIRAERIQDAVRGAFVAVRTVVLIGIILLYLGYEFSLFPGTRGLSDNVSGFALRPLRLIGEGFVRNLPNLVFLIVLFVVVRLALKMTRLFFGAVERRAVTFSKFEAEWAQPTYKIVRVAIVAFALVIAYPYIPGSNSPAFQGISLFAGLLLSLGSTSAISNIVAGYALIYRRAFKLGDRIKVGGSVGDVVATRLQVTHLRSVKNEEVIIPNSQILSGEVLNYSSLARDEGLILHTEVGIGYDTSWRHVENMLIEAAMRTEGLGTEPRPYVLLKELAEFAVTYELNVYTNNVKSMGRLYAALHKHILDVFNENGVQIMTPAYEGDPEAPKVVPPPSK